MEAKTLICSEYNYVPITRLLINHFQLRIQNPFETYIHEIIELKTCMDLIQKIPHHYQNFPNPWMHPFFLWILHKIVKYQTPFSTNMLIESLNPYRLQILSHPHTMKSKEVERIRMASWATSPWARFGCTTSIADFQF